MSVIFFMYKSAQAELYINSGVNYLNGDYNSKGFLLEIGADDLINHNRYYHHGAPTDFTLLGVFFNYTGSQLRINKVDDDFIFQHRFSLSCSIGYIFYLSNEIRIIPFAGFGFSKYLNYGNIPNLEIENMSNIYPSMPLSLNLYFHRFLISYKVDYYGNVFRMEQPFSGFRHFLSFGYSFSGVTL